MDRSIGERDEFGDGVERRGRRMGRGLSWIVCALLIVAGVETLVAQLLPGASDRTNFFEYRYGHDEAPERVLVEDKLRLSATDDPTIVQVGDSSGFHGVMPPVVEQMIPGARYLNMSVFANLGYRGHYEMARSVLAHAKNVRALVLYITPAGFQPTKAMVEGKDLLGDDIWREFVSPLHALFHIPSLSLRRDVTGLAYEGRTRTQAERDALALHRYPEAKALIPESGGWTREHDNSDDRVTGVMTNMRIAGAFPSAWSDAQVMAAMTWNYGESPSEFDIWRLRKISLAEKVFEDFRALAEAHGAQLIIAAAPVSEVFRAGAPGQKLAEFEAGLEAYHAKHPSVGIIPMVYWPDNRFTSPVHVSTPFTRENSVRFATALAAAMRQMPALPAVSTAPARPIVEEMSARDITGHGFSAPRDDGATAYRTFRDDRAEALIFTRIKPNAKRVEIDLAPDTPESAVQALSLSVFGEAAERMPESATREGAVRRVTWRLPEGAMRYGGWMEILLSTRGARVWSATPDPEATGLKLKISRVRFASDQAGLSPR